MMPACRCFAERVDAPSRTPAACTRWGCIARRVFFRANLGFAAAVAEVGMLLRKSQHGPTASYEAAIARARKFRQNDPDGTRAEFIKLAELAASLERLTNH